MSEKKEPIRILQCVNDMHRAGLETMLMNYYRNIDRTKIQFDFLTHRPNKSDYDDEIISLGGKVYYAPRLYPQNYPKYFKWMKQFFKEHPEYEIVHSHIDVMSYLPLLAAKKNNVPIRIAHSHTTSIDKDFKYLLKHYFKSRIKKVATNNLACGEKAGHFLFKNSNFDIIPNAVDAEKFYFNNDIRQKKRKNLGLENKFVIGHVGRFCYPKNHKFLVDVFNEIAKTDENAILLLIGVGENYDKIKNYVSELKLNDKVIFLGNRADTNELYQVMDVFVLPSLFEGIPLVGVEAQFADLPCIFSDTVSTEVQFNDNVQYVNLKESLEKWAEIILSKKDNNRNSNKEQIKNSKYDIKVAHKILEDYYNNEFKKIKVII